MNQFSEEMWNSPNGYHIPVLTGAEESDSAILLCVRGFGGNTYSAIVGEIAENLKSHVMGTCSFSWPAHGKSDTDGDSLTVENCLRDMETVVTEIRRRWPGKKLFCFATSFGGYMTVLYHREHPEEFERIILRSPAVRMADTVWSFLNEEQIVQINEGKKLDFGFDDHKLMLGREFYDNLRAYPVHQMKPVHPEKFSIIMGDADEVVSPKDVEEFAQRNGIPVEWVKGANHQYEVPGGRERVVEIVRNIIEKK